MEYSKKGGRNIQTKAHMINVLSFYHDSIVDGEGLRTVIFFAGCPHKCLGCHNPESWNEKNGKNYTVDEILKKVSLYPDNEITFSGGEPLQQASAIISLAIQLKAQNKNIWCYTGYTIEEILTNGSEAQRILLSYIDVLIDGQYENEKRNTTLPFRGSSNQKIIYQPSHFLINQ